MFVPAALTNTGTGGTIVHGRGLPATCALNLYPAFSAFGANVGILLGKRILRSCECRERSSLYYIKNAKKGLICVPKWQHARYMSTYFFIIIFFRSKRMLGTPNVPLYAHIYKNAQKNKSVG